MVRTDNNPMSYVLTTAKLDATGHRWLATLANYHFTIQYRSGRKHGDADGFSRRPALVSGEYQEVDGDTMRAIFQGYGSGGGSWQSMPAVVSLAVQDTVTEAETDPPLASEIDWNQRQSEDPIIARVVELKRSGCKPSAIHQETPPIRVLLRECRHLKVQDGVLVRVRLSKGKPVQQLVLQEPYRHNALTGLHDNMGHLGVDQTLDLAQDCFFWPKMDNDVQKWVASCKRCLCRKQPERKSSPLVSIKTSQPMELVCMDFLTLETSKDGYDNIFVTTDHFTCYAQAIPTSNQTTSTTARVLLKNYIVYCGFPARLHSAPGRNFESTVIRDLCKIAGVAKSRTIRCHPMGKRMCERFNQTLLAMLGTLSS